MPLFCRHNRFEHTCPICSKPAKPAARRASPSGTSSRSRSGGATTRTTGVVRRQLARAGDDGYRHALVPGIKATADAERLAACLAVAAARLEPPGPHPEVAAEGDPERAARLAAAIALDRTADPGRAMAAFEAWIAKSGSAEAAFIGEPGWSPARRFARTFDRLALPGFTRAARYELLTTLGVAGTFQLEADALHVDAGSDETVLAAKRVLNSGETMLLERRAAELAEGTGVPIGALDHALALWERSEAVDEVTPERVEPIRRVLRLDADA